jgi:hypothetical protein
LVCDLKAMPAGFAAALALEAAAVDRTKEHVNAKAWLSFISTFPR